MACVETCCTIEPVASMVIERVFPSAEGFWFVTFTVTGSCAANTYGGFLRRAAALSCALPAAWIAAWRITSTETVALNTPVNFPPGAGLPTGGVITSFSPGKGVELANTFGTSVPTTSSCETFFDSQRRISLWTCFCKVCASALTSAVETDATFVAPPPVIGLGLVTAKMTDVEGIELYWAILIRLSGGMMVRVLAATLPLSPASCAWTGTTEGKVLLLSG